MNTVEFSVDSAVAENIKDITCMATNDHGVVNKTVKITEVGKSVVTLTVLLSFRSSFGNDSFFFHKPMLLTTFGASISKEMTKTRI